MKIAPANENLKSWFSIYMAWSNQDILKDHEQDAVRNIVYQI